LSSFASFPPSFWTRLQNGWHSITINQSTPALSIAPYRILVLHTRLCVELLLSETMLHAQTGFMKPPAITLLSNLFCSMSQARTDEPLHAILVVLLLRRGQWR